ncbi:MAG: ASPIC/UnbV domain-containing protein [Planctomycetaceae bacterium]
MLRLVGQRQGRESTGATVKLLDVDPPQVRMLTAGDGFLVTNERRLQLSVPRELNEATVEVRWLDGHTQTFSGLPTSGEVLLIEDQPEPLALPLEGSVED